MLIMFYKSPRAGTALAVLSRGRHPGEAARAVHTGIALQLSATAPASATYSTLCQLALFEDASLTG